MRKISVMTMDQCLNLYFMQERAITKQPVDWIAISIT